MSLTHRKSTPYRVNPASLGKVNQAYRLEKALALTANFEDEEFIRKSGRNQYPDQDFTPQKRF